MKCTWWRVAFYEIFPVAKWLFFNKFFRQFFPTWVISSQQRFAQSHFTLTMLSNAKNETKHRFYWGVDSWRNGYCSPPPPPAWVIFSQQRFSTRQLALAILFTFVKVRILLHWRGHQILYRAAKEWRFQWPSSPVIDRITFTVWSDLCCLLKVPTLPK